MEVSVYFKRSARIIAHRPTVLLGAERMHWKLLMKKKKNMNKGLVIRLQELETAIPELFWQTIEALKPN